jgi:hypothetical protein
MSRPHSFCRSSFTRLVIWSSGCIRLLMARNARTYRSQIEFEFWQTLLHSVLMLSPASQVHVAGARSARGHKTCHVSARVRSNQNKSSPRRRATDLPTQTAVTRSASSTISRVRLPGLTPRSLCFHLLRRFGFDLVASTPRLMRAGADQLKSRIR